MGKASLFQSLYYKYRRRNAYSEVYSKVFVSRVFYFSLLTPSPSAAPICSSFSRKFAMSLMFLTGSSSPHPLHRLQPLFELN